MRRGDHGTDTVLEHAGRQVYAGDAPGVAALGKFGQVRAVTAADVDHDLVSGEVQRRQDLGGKVDGTLATGVDGLPGGQIAVVGVLHVAQIRRVGPRRLARLRVRHDLHRNAQSRDA